MVAIPSLWAPILLGAVLVFVGSSVIHMLLKYHSKDFAKVPDEDAVMDALRPFDLRPGDYVLPYAGSAEAMKSDAFRQKVEKGPVAFFTVLESGAMFDMGKSLTQWFFYCVLIGVLSAYVAGRTLAPGAEYMPVFRIAATVAFCCFSIGLMQRSIWYKQSWRTTLVSMFDGLIYACLMAGALASMWPE